MATKKKVTVENTNVEAAVEAVAEKKAPAKKTASKKVKCEIQFAGKSYTQDDLVKIAKDVWVYDLGQKASALKNIELYVKVEESKAYYVFNETESGFFMI